MFRISKGKLSAFGKQINILEGTNTLYMEDGNLFYSTDETLGSAQEICTINKAGSNITITKGKDIKKETPNGNKILLNRAWIEGFKTSYAPTYGGGNVATHLEGFAFDFNYTNIGYVATTMAGYMFIGGPINKTNNPPFWQASVGNAFGADLFYSFCFAWRSGRKHFYFQRGYRGIYKCGNITAKDYISNEGQ